MRSLVIGLACLSLAGCRVCVNACKKEQGRAATAIAPNADGSLTITTCTLTTEGTGGTVDACRDHVIPAK